jgi:ligand-binding sensor domain-containing protein
MLQPSHRLFKLLFLTFLFISSFDTVIGDTVANVRGVPTIKPAFDQANIPELSSMEDVRFIYQDKVGIIWLSTTDGLISYNINTTKRYSHIADNPKSLSNNVTSSIAEDANGNLWIATQNGLNRLDIEKQEFSHYLIRPTSDENYVNNRVYDVFVDSKQRIWAATAAGLHLFNEVHDSFTNFRPWHPEYSYKNLDIWAYNINEDEEGNIWLGTSAGGIIKFDPNKHHFTHFSSHKNNKNKFPIDFINAIHVLSPGNLLVGTETGLFKFDTRKRVTVKVLPELIKSPITALEKADDGAWWFISNTVLFRLAPDLKTVEQRGIIASQKHLNSQQKATALFIDKENNIWTSFKDFGVYRLSGNSKRVQTVNFSTRDKAHNFSKVNAARIHKDSLWVAATQDLSLIDLSNQKSRILLPSDESKNIGKTISGGEVDLGGFNAIDFGSDNRIYVARDGGISIIDVDGQVENHSNSARYPTSSIIVDQNNNAWYLAGERGVKIHGTNLANHPFYTEQSKLIADDYAKTKYLFTQKKQLK